MEMAIETAGLTRRFGPVTAVDGLTMQVRAGELLALVGPDGAGRRRRCACCAVSWRPAPAWRASTGWTSDASRT